MYNSSMTRTMLHTCSSTLALSTGAVTRVEGPADKNPAVASSATDNDSLFRLGVIANISCFDMSYAYVLINSRQETRHVPKKTHPE